jgi:hypothetical protein
MCVQLDGQSLYIPFSLTDNLDKLTVSETYEFRTA